MEDANLTTRHKCSLELLEQLQHSIDADEYYLTQDDRDSLFYSLEQFKNRLNAVYAERMARDGD